MDMTVPDSKQRADSKKLLSARQFVLHLRQLSIISLVALLVTSGILIFLYRQDQLAEHMAISTQENENTANHLMRLLDDRIYTLITTSKGLDTRALRANPNIGSFPSAQEMAREYGILKLKIYDRSGTTLYSSAKAEIGETNRHPDLLAKALRGEVSNSQEFREKFLSASGEMHGIYISLTYMPLVHAGVRIGAIEIYRDITPLFERLKVKTIQIALIMFCVISALYAALYAYMRRTDRAVAEWQERLTNSEARYRAVAQSASDAIVTADNAGNIASCNKSVEAIFGYTEAELMGQPLTVLMSQRFRDLHRTGMRRLLSGGEPHLIGKQVDLVGRRKDASEFPLELSLAQWNFGEQQFFTGFIRDITERKTADAKIQRRTQLFAALSQCNKAIVHCNNAEELFLEVCRIVVKLGGMKMAWVGITDIESHMVQPAASFGDDLGYLQNIEISTDADSPFGRGPIGTAIRENRPFWCQDFLNDPVMAPWHEHGVRSGWGSVAALPLQRNGDVIGALALYAGEINAFDEAERELLIGVCADISFAVDNFDREAQRRLAEASLENMAAKYRTVFESSTDAIMLLDEKGFFDCNEAALRMFGCPTRDEFFSKHPSKFSPPTQPAGEDSLSLANQYLAMAFKSGSKQFEWQHRRLDGTDFSADVLLTALELDGKPVLQATVRDITERKRIEMVVQDSREKLRLLLDSMAEGAYGVDTSGHCTFVNRVFLQTLGYQSEDEVLGAHIHELIHHSHADGSPYPANECKMYRAYQTLQQINVSDEVFWRKDGVAIPVEYWSHPITTNGVVIGAVATFIDITERKRMERELLLLQSAIENSSSAFYRMSSTGMVLYCNKFACQSLGYTKEELTGMYVWEYAPDFPSEAWAPMWEKLRQTRTVNFETRHRRKDGTIFPVEVFGNMADYEGEEYSFTFVKDVSLRRRQEQELRIAATAFEGQEGIIVTDANKIILRVNQAFTKITGYTAEDAIGQTPALLQSGRHDPGFYQQMWKTLNQDNYWHGEIWNRRKNGEVYPEWLTISAVIGPEGNVTNYVGSFSDITLRMAAESRIEQLAFFDPLTGLPNLRLLHDRLQQAFAASARDHDYGALLFIDLDNFKILNDTRGHNIGDLLLIEAAGRVQANVREVDTVARLGGDEFVVLLEKLDVDHQQAAAMAEIIGGKILSALSQTYTLSSYDHHSSASIGISLFHDQEVTADELLKHADSAMYQAKNAGRNTMCFYDPAIQELLEAREALERDLRRALEENQFKLYYQIQVMHPRHIVGAEVLIRWQHPDRGLVSPLEFIPLAEETGLILPVGQWVLETACTQLKAWEADPLTHALQLSVNVSARQFRQADFIEQVSAVLEKTAANPRMLKLELTESLVLDDINDTIVKMQALKTAGVRFSLDDFGTGYSSLAYLTQLPLDQLKIDQSFVCNIGVKESDAVIVQTIIGMADNLGLEVIAEGVETEAQHKFLKQHGCSIYQGYLFGRPVPLAEFEEARLRSV